MHTRIACIAIGVLSMLLVLPFPTLAQGNNCSAVVYFYDTGQNIGQCSDVNSPCLTMEYALEQGLLLCSERVAVFYADPNNPYQQLDWQPPPPGYELESTMWAVGGWIGPAIGLVLGWLAAWLWARRSHGGAV